VVTERIVVLVGYARLRWCQCGRLTDTLVECLKVGTVAVNAGGSRRIGNFTHVRQFRFVGLMKGVFDEVSVFRERVPSGESVVGVCCPSHVAVGIFGVELRARHLAGTARA